MEKESTREQEQKFPEKGYGLLAVAAYGMDLTVRDDQYEFQWLLYIIKANRRRRQQRFRLIDSGKLDVFKLEQLGKEGADFYTSDKVRAKQEEIELINRACRKGSAIVAYSYQNSEETSFSTLEELGRCGVYLHLSNRKTKHDFSKLSSLADSCQRGGSWLVYYHYGPLEPSLEDLARNSAWIHISDVSLKEPKDSELLLEILRARTQKRTNLVLHVEKAWKASQLRDIIKAGAVVLFQSTPSDFKSPLRSLERESQKKKLDFRSYYLYPNLLL